MDNQPKKLYRSLTDRRIAGICGGLGEYFNVDPTVVRIAFVAGFFLSGSLIFWAYLVMWIVVPESPTL
jgi:phage shock protein C